MCVESNSTIRPFRKNPVFSATRAACCMLCVTITIVYCDFSSKDQVLDLRSRNRVQRRGRLVHQQHLRIHRQRPRNAQPLLLAAGKARARLLLQVVLHLVPQAPSSSATAPPSRPARAGCYTRSASAPTPRCRKSTWSETDSAAETPSPRAAGSAPAWRPRRCPDRRSSPSPSPAQWDWSRASGSGSAQTCSCRSPRPNQRRGMVRRNIQIDVLQRVIRPVPRIQIRNFNADAHVLISPSHRQNLRVPLEPRLHKLRTLATMQLPFKRPGWSHTAPAKPPATISKSTPAIPPMPAGASRHKATAHTT